MNSSRPYLIRALYEWIVENDCTPHLLVDADYPGARVPPGYAKDGQVVLNVSPSAVRHLHMDNDAVSFEGRFAGGEREIRFSFAPKLLHAGLNTFTFHLPDAHKPASEDPRVLGMAFRRLSLR